MTGERDISRLRRQMAPQLHPETYVYCSLPDFVVPPGMNPICTFREAEGTTVIVTKAEALHHGLPHVFEARLITLTVHSSLDAVGFLATLAGQLALARIPCNVVAAYYHDHLFVPTDRAADAMELLSALAMA